ncbi:MAG: hypothetical protein NZ519_04045 [Bacteroidia bacterium]|nr:hypothetical protein [Bacteroidia bacterium]MDW8302307.1 hypothetical protein [Bacteroidia bacterium]
MPTAGQLNTNKRMKTAAKFATPIAVATEYLSNANKQFNELVKGERSVFDFKEFFTAYKIEGQIPTFAEITEPSNYPTYEQVMNEMAQFNQVLVDTVQSYNQYLIKQNTQFIENLKNFKNPFFEAFKAQN